MRINSSLKSHTFASTQVNIKDIKAFRKDEEVSHSLI